jgi:hypothetical protein
VVPGYPATLGFDLSTGWGTPNFGKLGAILADPDEQEMQELAGHSDLTTQRYMHLSPAAIENAIRLLDVATSVAQTRSAGDK